jgi:hypothetical protein
MGRVVVRGTRDLPKVYADYYDRDGTRRTRALSGVRTKAEGRRLLAEIELRVAAGRPGMPADEQPAGVSAREHERSLMVTAVVSTAGPLMRRWLDGLENRNAQGRGRERGRDRPPAGQLESGRHPGHRPGGATPARWSPPPGHIRCWAPFRCMPVCDAYARLEIAGNELLGKSRKQQSTNVCCPVLPDARPEGPDVAVIPGTTIR